MTDPTALPDSKPDPGWQIRRGLRRFYVEQILDDKIVTEVSASLCAVSSGEYVAVWTVSVVHRSAIALRRSSPTRTIEVRTIGECVGATQAEAKSAFESAYRSALDRAIAQVRAAIAAGDEKGSTP